MCWAAAATFIASHDGCLGVAGIGTGIAAVGTGVELAPRLAPCPSFAGASLDDFDLVATELFVYGYLIDL